MLNPDLVQLGTMAQVNPLSPPALAQAAPGVPVVPTGEVQTKHEPDYEQKIAGPDTRAAMSKLRSGLADELKAKGELKDAAVQAEGFEAKGAEAQADAAQKKSDDLDKLEEQEAEFRAKRAAEIKQELEDFKKAQKITTLYQDATPLRRFVSALAIGAGSYAASMNGGPNTAFEIYKEQEENHRRAQEAELKRQTEKMLASGKSADEVLRFFDSRRKTIDMAAIARNDLAEKQVLALKVAIPQAAAKADEAAAQLKQRGAELEYKLLEPYDMVKRQVGTTTQVSSGDKTGQSVRAPDPQKAAFGAAAEENRKKALELKKLKDEGMIPTPSELREIENNKNKILGAGEEEKHSAFKSYLGQLKRDVGVLPSKFFPENYPDAKKRAYTLIWQLAEPAAIRETQSVGWMSNPEMSHAVLGMRIPQPDEAEDVANMKVDQLIDGTIAVADKIAKDSSLGIMDRKQDAIAARAAAAAVPASHASKAKTKAVGASSDYDFIVSALRADPRALDPQRVQAFKEAIEAQKKARAQGKDDPRALRAMKLIRDELPKD